MFRLKTVRRWALVDVKNRAVCFSYRMQSVKRKADQCAKTLRYLSGIKVQARSVEVRDVQPCLWTWSATELLWNTECSGLCGAWSSSTPPKCCPECGAKVEVRKQA